MTSETSENTIFIRFYFTLCSLMLILKFNTPAKTTQKRNLRSVYVAFIHTLSYLSYDYDCVAGVNQS